MHTLRELLDRSPSKFKPDTSPSNPNAGLIEKLRIKPINWERQEQQQHRCPSDIKAKVENESERQSISVKSKFFAYEISLPFVHV